MKHKRTSTKTLDDIQLQVLQLMLEATRAKVITWKVSDSDQNWYYNDFGPLETYINFKFPEYKGDVGSDPDCVDVGGAGRFMIGTPGWQLALEILSIGFEDWKKHLVSLREGYQHRIVCLKKALQSKARQISKTPKIKRRTNS